MGEMMTVKRHVVLALLTAVSTILLSVALAESPAYAVAILNPHPTCPGGLIDTYGVNGPYADGTVFLYYSSANSGTNCAWFQRSNNRGTPIYMYVHIMRCPAGAFPGDICSADVSQFDGGNFKYYAGPVQVTGTASRCIRLTAGDSSGTVLFTHNVHCG